LVQALNGHLEETSRLHGRLAELVSVLVQYLQHVLPVMDARDRVSTALATTRAELVLETFDRRQESLARRLDALLALRDRVEVLREGGIAGGGVEANAQAAAACRARGLDVVEGDLVDFLGRQPAGSLGGIFAAQVVEHLPPAVLQDALGAAHRALRPGGRLV